MEMLPRSSLQGHSRQVLSPWQFLCHRWNK